MKKPVDSRIQYLATFLGFTTIENIDKFYNKKFQTWLYKNSHFIQKTEPNPDELFFRKYDSDGNIINAKFSRATKDGILLNEKDFIDLETSILNNLEASLLPIDDKMRIEFYKNYLISKQTSDEPGKEKDLEDFLINIKDKQDFIQDLKKTFPTEKGKSIKAIIEILIDENLLVYGTKEFKRLHKVIGLEFNRSIGKLSGVSFYKKEDLFKDKEFMFPIKTKLKLLISKYK